MKDSISHELLFAIWVLAAMYASAHGHYFLEIGFWFFAFGNLTSAFKMHLKDE